MRRAGPLIVAALVLALVDVVFVTRHVISPIYLADAAVETVLVAAWAWAALRREADRENARG